MSQLPPLSLYIHYPWCVKKCPYCDFNSHEKGDKSNYIVSLLADLEQDLPYVEGRQIHSVFIGGGTPSLMSIQELEVLLTGLYTKLNFHSNVEITLETNPNSFEVDKFQAFKALGVNRLSIGVQSFMQDKLQSLGRVHSAKEAMFACEQADKIFDNFNLDLMYGLTGQSVAQSQADIKQAFQFNPSHISFYQLTLEPNTYFAKFPPCLPNEDLIWQMGEMGVELLEAHGFERYEVSAFGKKPSKHNLNYWQFGDYLGIGAGAHGKITQSNQPPFRTLKAKLPKDYQQNTARKITPIDNLVFDFMLNALRLKEGFKIDLFQQRTGKTVSDIEDKLQQAQKMGLLNKNDTYIKPSQKGYDFLNDLQQIFL
jgi:oxygen-independent coproporphyrinogen-3 oxidase